MNLDYILPNNWSIIEEGFNPELVKSSESIFSLGNGAMGQRANFEETYTGATFQGSYIAGVYYPDKTRVGWWKNGYPEYFAKVLNAPNWIGINVVVNGVIFDLNTCKTVNNFRRELNMKEGWLQRSFQTTLPNDVEISVKVTRFLSLDLDELGAIKYEVTPLNTDANITFEPYLDSGIKNEDSNWDDKFWDTLNVSHDNHQAFIQCKTMKTHFHVCAFMESEVFINNKKLLIEAKNVADATKTTFSYTHAVKQNETYTICKFGGYTVDRNYAKDELVNAAKLTLKKAKDLGFETLIDMQKQAWANIWENGRYHNRWRCKGSTRY